MADVKTFGVRAGIALKVNAKQVELPVIMNSLRDILLAAIKNSNLKDKVTLDVGLTGIDDFAASSIDGDERFYGQIIPHGQYRKEHDARTRKTKGTGDESSGVRPEDV